MVRAGGWNNLANETNVSNASPPGSKSPGRVRHERGSIWVFKGHAKFYFRIRAATVVSRSQKCVERGDERERDRK